MATTAVEKPMLPAELRGEMVAGHYNLEQMYRLAQLCQQSRLFEDVTDAAQAFIKIAKGQELGLPPMTAMSAFDIIAKRLFIKPWAIAAKINSCGYGRYTVLEQSVERCTIRFARKVRGLGWENFPPVSYTIDEATAHGLVKRSPHWQTSPAHMLYQRCMGRGGAMYFPELLAGIEPPPEETVVSAEQAQQNVIELFGETVDPTDPARRTSEKASESPLAGPTGHEEGQQASVDVPAAERTREAPRGPQAPVGTNGSWRDNVAALVAAFPDLLTPQTPQALADRVQAACAEAQRVIEAADTPLPTGEGMLERLRTLHAQVTGQLRLGLEPDAAQHGE